MKNLLFIISLASIILIGCKKENISNNDQNDASIGQDKLGDDYTYIYKGHEIDSSEIDWDSETLHIVIGFSSSIAEILVFEDDEDLVAWADTTQGGDYFIETLEEVNSALLMAVKLCEYDEFDTTCVVSEKYQNYLAGLMQSNSRGVTKLYWDEGCTGSEKMIWVPTSNVGSTWNNQTSSLQFATIGCFLANYTWWGGQKRWYFAATYEQINYLGNFNDKTTSVWIF
jgi:hypothetical protein